MVRSITEDYSDLLENAVIFGDTLHLGYGATVEVSGYEPIPIRAVNRYGIYHRWKTGYEINGTKVAVTDGRERWELKNELYKNNFTQIYP